jgi:hypothetical protein
MLGTPRACFCFAGSGSATTDDASRQVEITGADIGRPTVTAEQDDRPVTPDPPVPDEMPDVPVDEAPAAEERSKHPDQDIDADSKAPEPPD